MKAVDYDKSKSRIMDFDQNKDGQITHTEFSAWLKSVECVPGISDRGLMMISAMAEVDHDAPINIDEYLLYIKWDTTIETYNKKKTMGFEEETIAGGDQHMNSKEASEQDKVLKKALQITVEKFMTGDNPEDTSGFDDFFSRANLDGDGHLTRVEFTRLLKS